MRLIAKLTMQADQQSDSGFGRSNAPAFTHVIGFDGGEAPFDRMIRNLILRTSGVATTAPLSKAAPKTTGRSSVQDGGQSQSWRSPMMEVGSL